MSIGAALISAGGSVLQGLGNLFGASKNNKNQLRMMHEQNAYNSQMWEKEKQFTLDMWNRQNLYNESRLADERAYNTPYMQMDRMREAGLNPYLAAGNIAMGQVQGTNASPPPTPSAPQSAPSPQLTPLNYGDAFKGVFDFLSNTALKQSELRIADATAKKLESEANIAQSQSAFADQMAQNGIAMLNEQLSGLKNDNKQKELDYKHKDLLFDSTYRTAVANATQTEQGIDLNRLTIESLELQNTASKLRNEYLPQELAVQLSTLRQNLLNLVETKRLTIAQASQAWAMQGKANAEAVGVRLNNKFFAQTFNHEIITTKLYNKAASYSLQNQINVTKPNEYMFWRDHVGGLLGSVGQLLGPAAHVYSATRGRMK